MLSTRPAPPLQAAPQGPRRSRDDGPGNGGSEGWRVYAIVLWIISISLLNAFAVVAVSGLVILLQAAVSGRFYTNGLRATWPVLVLMGMGASIGAFVLTGTTWDFVRDAVYLAKVPLIATVTVVLLGETLSAREFARALVLAGCAMALIYLGNYLMAGGGGLARRALRTEVGRGYVAEVFAIVAILSGYGMNTRTLFGKSAALAVLVLLIAPIIASTSRTLPTAMFYFLLAWVWLRLGWRFGILLAVVIAIVMVLSLPPVLAAIGEALISYGDPSLTSLVQEMVMSDFSSTERINSFYRAYEATMAWQQFQGFSALGQLLGHGFGERIQIVISVTLGATADGLSNYQSVPITHISAMTALVKFGWIGLGFYFSTLVSLAWLRKAPGPTFLSVLNNGTVILLAHIILTFQGLFATLDIVNVSITVAVASLMLLRQQAQMQAAAPVRPGRGRGRTLPLGAAP